MFAKRLFYVSASLLTLAAAYHLGASTATAQASSSQVVAMSSGGGFEVMTANGDLYASPDALHGAAYHLVQNVFSGTPTPAAVQSWGSLKAKYR